MALPCGVMGFSAVCDYGVSKSYLLFFIPYVSHYTQLNMT